MKFILFVEGYTERALPAFFKRWLDPRLDKPVGIQTVRFEGWAELVKDTPNHAKIYLNAPKSDVIAVIALLDLYGLQLPYPDDMVTAADKFIWARQHLEIKVGHAKFRQFFAVHETEAWLLSNVGIFPSEIKSSLTTKTKQPEMVNFDKPPAKLLDEVYQSKTGRHYKKVTNGEELFAKLDPAIAYDKCPHLKLLLDELLALAQEAGQQPASLAGIAPVKGEQGGE